MGHKKGDNIKRMEVLELARPVKGTGWVDLVLEVAVNGENWEMDAAEDFGKYFPPEKEGYLRSLTSGIIKAQYPERVYKVSRGILEGKKIIKVRRLK